MNTQAQIDRLNTQITNVFSFVESGLAHLSRQLDQIAKNNDSTKAVIKHLKAVLESNFHQINKQEDALTVQDKKMNQLFALLKSVALHIDEKCASIDELSGSVKQLITNTVSIPEVVPFVPSTPEMWFPVTPTLFPEVNCMYESGLADIEAPNISFSPPCHYQM